MATISDITTIANATGAAHSYTYLTLANQGGAPRVVLRKQTTGDPGTSGGYIEAVGVHASVLTTAQVLALKSLNAQRKHRYAGSPGSKDGATVVKTLTGDGVTAPTVDTN